MSSLLQVADADQQYLLLDGLSYIRSVSPMVRLPDAVIMDDQTCSTGYPTSSPRHQRATMFAINLKQPSSAENYKVSV